MRKQGDLYLKNNRNEWLKKSIRCREIDEEELK